MPSRQPTEVSDARPRRELVWIAVAAVASMWALIATALLWTDAASDAADDASVSSQPATSQRRSPQGAYVERSESLETIPVETIPVETIPVETIPVETIPVETTLGVYPGFGDDAALREFEDVLGTRPGAVVQFGDRRSAEEMVNSVQGALSDLAAWIQDGDPTYALAIPLAFGRDTASDPEESARIVDHLARTAEGAHDDEYRFVASRLIDAGLSDAVLRLGHEPDGDWYPWSSQPSCPAYIEAFRHVADLFRAESSSFRIEWTVTLRYFEEFGPCAYPGDDVVDIIGLDVYDRGGQPSAADGTGWIDPAGVWEEQFRPRLESHLAFVTDRGKPVSYPEWGIVLDHDSGPAGGDNPYFVNAMADWFASLPDSGAGSLSYQAYFIGVADYDIRFAPESWQAFQERFGVS